MNKIKRISFHFCLVLIGIGILLLAGWDNQRATAARPDIWIPAASLPEPLGGHSVQCPDQPDTIYIVGGINATGSSNKLYRYVPNNWDSLADLPIPLRAMGVACYQDRIYVAGGLLDVMNRLYIYDIPTDTWMRGADLPDPTGGAHLGAWDGKLYLMGGSRLGGLPYTPISRVDVYDIASNTWTAGGATDMLTPTAYYG
ncbi:MAG: kelch repeat-containing protein, partial [Anaerolineales bacterium]